MTDKTAPITRYCFRSEGMSDPPEQFESPTGDVVDYWDHLQIEKELLARIESLEAQLSARQAATERLPLSHEAARKLVWSASTWSRSEGVSEDDVLEVIAAVERAQGIGATNVNL